ncbi:Hint domain-containing protein [uncultured Ruegeria sp.]|uniref:Hint domain-containing protein n=1 Tax=uncultured Ruegeria sp. TaxID=259304 RepID=UPI0026143F69|nr:Hint domain-containing protein [uncultured Ruegeria sp.]
MVLRSFFAQDSSSLIVTASSNGSIIGNPIVNNSDTPDGTVFQYSAGTGTTVTLDDTFDVNVFNDDDPANHVITDGGGIVANGTQVEAESQIIIRALDSGGNPVGPEITVYVFSQGGVFSDVWGYATSAPLQNGTSYVKVSGSNIGTSAYTNFMACFGEGTLIETAVGDVPVQNILPGDEVWTKDRGLLPVRWVGTTEVRGFGTFAPVVIEAGVLGNTGELVLSQQHRVLIESSGVEMLFGQSEVLVAAKHLCGLPGVNIREMDAVRYTHFMFDGHHIVRSNGALTESFFLEKNAVKALSSPQRQEILSLFPSLNQGTKEFGSTVAMTINAQGASVLRSYMATQ